MNTLKLRATYGFNGNVSSEASGYPIIYHSTYLTQIPTGANYAQIQNPANQNLKWEKSRMLNLGLDFSIWNNKLDGSIELYLKKGIDLLGAISSDPTTGWVTYIGNYASIKGKGVDLMFNVKNKIGQVKLRTSFNISFNSDKVLSYGGQNNLQYAYSLVEGFPVQVGKTLYALNSYRWAGLDSINGLPQILISDTASSFTLYNQAKSSDISYAGSRSPRIFGNIINFISWNNFTLSFNITYKLKYFFRRATFNNLNSIQNNSGGHLDYVLRWKKPGDESITSVPAAPTQGNDARYVIYSQSNRLVEKADHIRMQDVRLSYDINRLFVRKLPFQNANVYFYVNNVGLLWKANKSGIDPSAIEFGSMPLPRTFSVGVNLTY